MSTIDIIKSEREKLNLPLRKLAAKVDVDTSTWAKIEKGERALRPEMLEPICDLLGLDLKSMTIEFWSDKLKKDLRNQRFAKDILKAVNEKLKD